MSEVIVGSVGERVGPDLNKIYCIYLEFTERANKPSYRPDLVGITIIKVVIDLSAHVSSEMAHSLLQAVWLVSFVTIAALIAVIVAAGRRAVPALGAGAAVAAGVLGVARATSGGVIDIVASVS